MITLLPNILIFDSLKACTSIYDFGHLSDIPVFCASHLVDLVRAMHPVTIRYQIHDLSAITYVMLSQACIPYIELVCVYTISLRDEKKPVVMIRKIISVHSPAQQKEKSGPSLAAQKIKHYLRLPRILCTSQTSASVCKHNV